jgi:chemotaxis methyl-accepting protein methylase
MQHFATFFLRNRPELELLRRIVEKKPRGSSLNMTVLACSKGAEVYSLAWIVRSARPDLDLRIHAIDISPEIVEFAQRGVYSMKKPRQADPSTEDAVRRKKAVSSIPSSDPYAWIFERLSQDEIDSIFDRRGEEATVRQRLREGIDWRCGDANDPALAASLGPQDIVVANRFLCHMAPPDAERCLRNIGRFVKPGGFLFVGGLDLDVRTKIALEQGWTPVTEMIREIHEGDDSLRNAWPLQYWGLEPLDDKRPDWQLRYASVFEIGGVPVEAGEVGLTRTA